MRVGARGNKAYRRTFEDFLRRVAVSFAIRHATRYLWMSQTKLTRKREKGQIEEKNRIITRTRAIMYN